MWSLIPTGFKNHPKLLGHSLQFPPATTLCCFIRLCHTSTMIELPHSGRRHLSNITSTFIGLPAELQIHLHHYKLLYYYFYFETILSRCLASFLYLVCPDFYLLCLIPFPVCLLYLSLSSSSVALLWLFGLRLGLGIFGLARASMQYFCLIFIF